MRAPSLHAFSFYLLISEYLDFSETKLLKRSPLELGLVTFPNPKIPKIIHHDDIVPAKSNHHIHVWVPGQVRHHAFVPPHSISVFVPVVVAKPVLVKEGVHIFRKADENPLVGGYGVGSYFGGQGSGHGFQIVFND